jgi:hypothetical protein
MNLLTNGHRMTSYAWGLDPAAAGFSLAVVDTMTRHLVHTERHEVGGRHSDEARVAALHDLALERFRDIAQVFPGLPPTIVGVEQPAGKYPNPKLMAGWSAITIAAVEIAAEAVVWLTPPAWRGREDGVALADFQSVGWDLCSPEIERQNAERGRPLRKDHPLRTPSKQAALAIARTVGYAGWDDNIADATCIAVAAAMKVPAGKAVAA